MKKSLELLARECGMFAIINGGLRNMLSQPTCAAPYINEKETIDLLTRLIRTDSANPPGNELAVARIVAARLEEMGLEVILQPIAEARANVIATLRGEGTRKSLMLSGHLDTVPVGDAQWEHDPFGAEIVGDRMYGLGAADMKGGIASIVSAVEALVRARVRLRGDLVLGLTAGEEVHYVGAKELLRAGYLENVGGMVIAEASGLRLVTATRGVLWIRINTVGKAAHGSMPSEGVNAVWHMHLALERLSRANLLQGSHVLLGSPSMAVTTFHGGAQTNVIPDCCSMTLDIRTVPPASHDQLLRAVRDILESMRVRVSDFNAEIEVLLDYPPVSIPREDPIVKSAQETAQGIWGVNLDPVGICYATEGSLYFPETGIPMIIYGPGDPGLCHVVDEYVSIPNVIDAAKFYAGLAQRVLGEA